MAVVSVWYWRWRRICGGVLFAGPPLPGMVSAVCGEGARRGDVLRGRAPASMPGVSRLGCPAVPRGPAHWLPGRVVRDASWPGSGGVVHDAVVAAAGAGAAGAGAVAGEHLGGGPAVEFHQVAFGSAAVEPGVAEVVPEAVRVGGHAALAAAAGDDLVDAGGGERPAAARAEPQLGLPGLRVPGAGAQVAVEAAGRLVADLAGAGLAAFPRDADLAGVQVQVGAGGVAGVVADPGEFGEPDAGCLEHGDDRGVAPGGE